MQRERIVEQGSWASLTHMVLMLILLVGTFGVPRTEGYASQPAAFWNNVLTAVIVIATSVRAASNISGGEYGVHALLGTWLLVAPWALQFSDTSVGLITMATGLIMAFTGMFAALQRLAARER